MFKRSFAAALLLLVLPAFAHAWYVNAKTSPVAGAGTISPSGNTSYNAGSDSGEYTVSPAANYKVSRVTIDGVAATPNGSGKYVVPYTGKNWRYIVAYFTPVTATGNINVYAKMLADLNYKDYGTAKAPIGVGVVGGAIKEVNKKSLKNVPVTESRTLKIIANPGYEIESYSAEGAATGPVVNPDGSVTYGFNGLTESGTYSVSAVFKPKAVLKVSAGPGVTANGENVAVNLYPTVITNAAGYDYAWSMVSGPAGGTVTFSNQSGTGATSSTAARTTVSGSVAGTYVLKLVVPGDTLPDKTTNLIVKSAAGLAEQICSKCHALSTPVILTDQPHSGGQALVRAQYRSDASRFVSCSMCHDGHDDNDVEPRIREQFADSGHGDVNGEAWMHYDWRASNRASCQRCHTGTGFRAKLGDENNTANVFQAGDVGKPGEVLNCSACHSNLTTGETVAATQSFTINLSNSATVTYDVPGASTLCARCHGGRETGESIKGSTGDFTNLGFINSHYLAAAGTLYNKAGYEYDGQSYDDIGYHKNVGTGVYNTGSQGPCVACHMGSTKNHTWEVVTKDAVTGAITAVVSDACAKCHGNLAAAVLEEAKETYEAALNALRALLESKGIYFYPAHPYFYKDTNANGVFDVGEDVNRNGVLDAGEDLDGDGLLDKGVDIDNTSTDAFKNWDGVYTGKGKDVMGAAFNYNLLEHEPGAYAHNRGYALKLIADSCDFLADGVVDGNGIPAAVLAARPATREHYSGVALAKAQYIAPPNVSCTNCHAGGNTAANADILPEYAESGHGDVNGEAWMHYDWRASNRASCQRCHTGTGFVAKLGNENNTANVFQSGDVGYPGEVLNCSACHADLVTGAVRDAGAFSVTFSNGATASFPDVGESNVCVRCHGGRENGDSIKGSAGDFANLSFINSHYLAAAGTVFASGGYEFDTDADPTTDNYLNVPYFEHNVAGIADPANPAATDAGPCVACHMGDNANHTWEVVTKDETGAITALNSATCATCHVAPYTIDAQGLQHESHGYHAALAVLQGALDGKGIYFYPAHPYFYKDTNANGVFDVGEDVNRNGVLDAGEDLDGDGLLDKGVDIDNTSTDAFKNWAGVYVGYGKDVMGAAFNYNYLHHEPGAYAHNRYYTKRLIFDSIDFILDGDFDGTLDLSAYPDAAEYFQHDGDTTNDNAVARP